ncbi:MAG: hypothetical protein K0R29_1265 [Pseudobdellovibrio sp.]|jgi:sulfatase maturation enzyme AslB (radical SAM superfamily)|nr:hypothetical protein [Pseudobdellovibrio sp.]
MKQFDNSSLYDKLKNIKCRVPLNELHIFEGGNTSFCCLHWLPTVVGNVNQNSLYEILNSPLAKDIQKSANDGSFTYCDPKMCPKISEYLVNGNIQPPLSKMAEADPVGNFVNIYFNYDLSCNLFCGSCRNQRIIYNEQNSPQHLIDTHQRVLASINELVEKNYKLTLNLTGSGDPFASPLYWKFLSEVKDDSQFDFELSTNGTLMTEERMKLPFAQKLKYIGISADAATEGTYEKVRRGGNYQALVKNVEHLNSLASENKLKNLRFWRLNFVVQNDNYHEMADFARWALSFNSISEVWFNLIADWGHLPSEEFTSKAVWKPEHPQHQKFLEVLKDPIFKNPKVSLGNANHYRLP